MLSGILDKIKPSPKEIERELNFCNVLLFRIKAHIPPGREVVLTGSMAKKTFLKDKKDIDIFILFDKKVPKATFESELKKIMANCFENIRFQLSYAEHPYLRFKYEGRRIDLVPAYKIANASERLSAVDRSVLHTKFVNSNLKQKQIDDVLLLKKFLQSNLLYGAEIKTKGFSGYLCELLIIYYGSFQKLLKAASKWEYPVFIDLKKYYKPGDAVSVISTFGNPNLIVIDPTDKDRNVAAAVSNENSVLFSKLCQKFMKKPSAEFFFREEPSFEEKLAKMGKGKIAYVVSMPKPDVVDDILWGQIYKMLGQFSKYLGDLGFESQMFADDHKYLIRLAVITENDILPEKRMVEGPPVEMKEHVDKFKKSHKRAKFSIKKKKIYAEVKRPVTRLKNAISNFFKDFSKAPSHLACGEELVIIEKVK